MQADRATVHPLPVPSPAPKKRKAEPKAAGSILFPEVEPWPGPLDVGTLLNDIRATIRRHIVCPTEATIAAALWIAFTWVIDFVQVAPLAVITAPEKRCGKSQFLDLIGRMVRKPLVASGITSAATFRVIEAHAPTLLIDEADTFMKDNEGLRGVINSGHTRQSAFVIRTVGDTHEPRQFSTWGAKAISGIGNLPATIMDRAIILELRRKLPSETVERLRHADPGHFDMLARKLARFAELHGEEIRRSRPRLPDALNDRAQDNWDPLLAIADVAGGAWPDLARRVALKLSAVDEAVVSTGAELLSDIRAAFDQGGRDRLTSADLIARLCDDEEAAWATYDRGRPLSPRQLGKRLGEYRITSRKIRFGVTTAQGFERSQFEDVWLRYLDVCPTPPDSSGTPEQSNEINELMFRMPDHVPEHSSPSGTGKPLKSDDCSGVPDGSPLAGETEWEEEL